MKLTVTKEFREDWEKFSFRFTCEHCAQFNADRETCAFGFPTEKHREARYQNAQLGDDLWICKDFSYGA